MTARVGTCSSCSSRFRIPDAYADDRAKCRKCGGVIEIAPAIVAGAPDSVPVAASPAETEGGSLSTTSEATAFSFASITARSAAASAATRESAQEHDEPAEHAEPDDHTDYAAREPVEPMVAPKPAAKRAPAPRRAQAEEPSHKVAARPPSEVAIGREKRGLLIGGAIAALLVVSGVIYLLVSGPGGGESNGAAPQPGESKESSASLAKPPSPSKEPASEPESPATPEAEPDPSAADADAEATPAPEPAPTKFEFVALERSPGTNDEEWDQMQELGAKLLEGGKARKLALKELLHYGIKAVPVLVNSLNGIDLSKYSQWVDGAEVSRFIQDDLLAETILIPYHGAFSTDVKEVRHNQVVLKSMVDYWNAQVNDPSRWGALLQKYDEKRATRGNRGDGD